MSSPFLLCYQFSLWSNDFTRLGCGIHIYWINDLGSFKISVVEYNSIIGSISGSMVREYARKFSDTMGGRRKIWYSFGCTTAVSLDYRVNDLASPYVRFFCFLMWVSLDLFEYNFLSHAMETDDVTKNCSGRGILCRESQPGVEKKLEELLNSKLLWPARSLPISSLVWTTFGHCNDNPGMCCAMPLPLSLSSLHS